MNLYRSGMITLVIFPSSLLLHSSFLVPKATDTKDTKTSGHPNASTPPKLLLNCSSGDELLPSLACMAVSCEVANESGLLAFSSKVLFLSCGVVVVDD